MESRYLDSEKKFEGKNTSEKNFALTERVTATFPHSCKSGPCTCSKKQKAHILAGKTKKTKSYSKWIRKWYHPYELIGIFALHFTLLKIMSLLFPLVILFPNYYFSQSSQGLHLWAYVQSSKFNQSKKNQKTCSSETQGEDVFRKGANISVLLTSLMLTHLGVNLR